MCPFITTQANPLLHQPAFFFFFLNLTSVIYFVTEPCPQSVSKLSKGFISHTLFLFLLNWLHHYSPRMIRCHVQFAHRCFVHNLHRALLKCAVCLLPIVLCRVFCVRKLCGSHIVRHIRVEKLPHPALLSSRRPSSAARYPFQSEHASLSVPLYMAHSYAVVQFKVCVKDEKKDSCSLRIW